MPECQYKQDFIKCPSFIEHISMGCALLSFGWFCAYAVVSQEVRDNIKCYENRIKEKK